MNKKIFVLFAFSFLFYLGFVSASTNGTFIGNSTNTITNTSAEFDVVAEVQATQYYAEVWLNTSEIDFGQVSEGRIYRQPYQIAARGNVNIKVVPTLTTTQDALFSNLYFSRTTTSWKKIGSSTLGLIFNLTQNEGLWTVIGSSDSIKNLSSSEKGIQNIQLDLTTFNEVTPFNEVRRNTVKFVIIPDWNNIPDPSP